VDELVGEFAEAFVWVGGFGWFGFISSGGVVEIKVKYYKV